MLGGLEDSANIFNMLIKEMATSGAQLKFLQPERPLKGGRILTTPNTKGKPDTPNPKEKSKEKENISASKNSSTGNNFQTPQKSSRKIFLFDSTSIKTLTTDNSTPEAKSSASSGRPKRVPKMPHQPVASIAQLREIMNDMKLISQAKVNQASPKHQAKSQVLPHQQQHIMPLPFVNMTKAQLIQEDPRALLPKKMSQAAGYQDFSRPLTAKSIKLMAQDGRVTSKEGIRRVLMPEKKVLRPSTTMGARTGSGDLQGEKTLTQNFNIFSNTMQVNKGTLADSLLIKQMKCEPMDDGEVGKGGKENKPHASSTAKNDEIKRPVKTCRIKLWSGKLNIQRKEEKESKGHEPLDLAHSLKSSGVYKEIKVEGKA